MNPELISRLISLVEKTGDRVVLVDPSTAKAVVVMDLESYEKMLGQPAQTAPAEPAPPVEKEEEPAEKPATATPSPDILPALSGKIPKQEVQQPVADKGEETATVSPNPAASSDLTQDELLDKINRDIGEWKTAQERKRTAELQAVVTREEPAAATLSKSEPEPVQEVIQPTGGLEEEERFYLEPIE